MQAGSRSMCVLGPEAPPYPAPKEYGSAFTESACGSASSTISTMNSSAGTKTSAGKKADAARLLRAAGDAAAKLPAEFGPPDLVKPPQELLGEWLLADGDAPGAQQAFVRALELWPGRLRALQGLAAAAAKAGDAAVAGAARAQLPTGNAGGR